MAFASTADVSEQRLLRGVFPDKGSAADAIDPKRALLSAVLPTTNEQRLTLGLVAVSILVFLVAIPFAQTPLLPVPAFIPAYEAALVLIDLITAVLLLGQFVQVRSRALLVLASGYFFDALIIVPHALTFPGLFAPTGLLGAAMQSTAWIYMFWHGGFAIFIIAFVLLQNASESSNHFLQRTFPLEPLLMPLGVVGLVCALTVLATFGHDQLPSIMQGNTMVPAKKLVPGGVWILSIAAVFALWKRRTRSALDLWLLAVMCAWVCDIGLSAVFNAGRFDLGFYAGRLYGLMAASFVLVVLVLETSGLHGRLIKTTAQLEQKTRKLEDDVRQSVSQNRQTEAQLRQAQKMEAIGNLTGGMAHDFNNLLGVVIGNLDMLRDRKQQDEEVQELAGDALDAALRGAELTRRLLAFARRQPLQPQRIDINALIDSIIKLLSRTLGENIQISLDLDAKLWPVIADPAQLEASLANLATNARDAMSSGGRLNITTGNRYLDSDYATLHPEVTVGDYAMIEVSDNGCGIPTEMLTRIFEPFFTTKEQGKGTGLGLSMVYGFMKQSGGHINVYSEPGMGSTFRLYLPRANQNAVEDVATLQFDTIQGNGEIVLAVEDNESLRRVATRQLKDLGYRVLEAESAHSALKLLEHEKVDLLFTDVVMPGGTTGIELAHNVQERWPHLRVVLTSGFPDTRLGGSEMPLGARLLNKPYRKQELAKALRDALDAPINPLHDS